LLRGLQARLQGDERASTRLLQEARGAWPAELRLHRALLAWQLSDRQEFEAVLRSVGGAALLRDEEDPLAALSDREKDVVALMAEGLSYAQIAKELYLSRSTVAFHLSNAYAKTGTGSRHELVQLIRRSLPQN
jgi:DNA-binding CsgD family transcriptional regulator